MAAGDESRRGQPHDAILADDDAVDVLLDPAEELGRAPGLQLALFRGHGARSSLVGSSAPSPD